ncbi:MAG TPA: hypothetical protein VMW79_07785 [Anaerolineae bacterium]|nr:hypothetical protein [Anaerolineae bacterium]
MRLTERQQHWARAHAMSEWVQLALIGQRVFPYDGVYAHMDPEPYDRGPHKLFYALDDGSDEKRLTDHYGTAREVKCEWLVSTEALAQMSPNAKTAADRDAHERFFFNVAQVLVEEIHERTHMNPKWGQEMVTAGSTERYYWKLIYHGSNDMWKKIKSMDIDREAEKTTLRVRFRLHVWRDVTTTYSEDLPLDERTHDES